MIAPVANGQSVTTAEDTAKAITLDGSDVENDPLTFAIVTGANEWLHQFVQRQHRRGHLRPEHELQRRR